MNMLVALALIIWLASWALNVWLSRNMTSDIKRFLIPAIFGITVLLMWELLVRGWDISFVILPKPSEIWMAIISNVPILWADFVQTILKGALSGYIIGCGAGFIVAMFVDKIPFLQRGLLPLGNFFAALPIVGLAPIMVMWFGFGWQSKAAIVVSMCFFPMLVNCVQGLKASDQIQQDLLHTYSATRVQSLRLLQLPTAAPFIFNGLKTCTTLSLIGAIVAEFFGSPIVGMGFRIQTGVGTLSLDLVWAEITVAAVVGTVFFGSIAMLERSLTFWHASQRGR